MLNNLKSKIITTLLKKDIASEELDMMLGRNSGYTLWMLENGDIKRFPFNDEDILADFLGITTKKITELNGKGAYDINNEHIVALTSSIFTEVKAFGTDGWESIPGKLSIYLRSCDMPGSVRDSEIVPIDGDDYEVLPANHRTDLYYTAGPVYRKKLSDELSVLVTKAYGEKINVETFELTNPILYGVYLVDSCGHLIDYLEVDSEFAFVLKQYKTYLELNELYDILKDTFEDECYYSID